MVHAIDAATAETKACILLVSFFALCSYLGCYIIVFFYVAVWWCSFNEKKTRFSSAPEMMYIFIICGFQMASVTRMLIAIVPPILKE